MEINTLDGCTYVIGSIPVTDFVALTGKANKKVIIDAGLSSKIGASIVFGLPDDLKIFAQNPLVLSMIKAKAELESVKYGFNQQAFKWLTEGETGSSSMAILHNTFNGGDKKQRSHPYDTGDFRRCRLLLEQVDHARESFSTMATVSMAWSNLVAHWSEVCDLMDEESPLWRQKSGSAKKANDLIRELVSAY